MSSSLSALFFDQDGVIADTEKDGHRVAFNRTFNEFRLGFQWEADEYGALLTVGGGKERLSHYLNANGIGDPAGRQELVTSLHSRKTEIFIQMIEDGAVPLRPGIRRVMTEAKENGLIVGICTTSQLRSATAVMNTLLAGIPVDFILAGDVVTRKKPDPEIYLTALEQTGLPPKNCLVIEDSHNGVTAARDAGIPVVATVNDYTIHEDLSSAEIVLSSLGDSEIPARVLSTNHSSVRIPNMVGLKDLMRICELAG